MPTWSGSGVELVFRTGGDQPAGLVSLRPAGSGPAPPADPAAAAPLVEIQALGHGRFPGSHRYADTVIGARLRYTGHSCSRDGTAAELRIIQEDRATGLRVTSVFRAADGVPAVRTWTEVALAGEGGLRLQAVTSSAHGAFLADSGLPVDAFDLVHGDSDRVAESRRHRTPLRAVRRRYRRCSSRRRPRSGRSAGTRGGACSGWTARGRARRPGCCGCGGPEPGRDRAACARRRHRAPAAAGAGSGRPLLRAGASPGFSPARVPGR